MYSAQHDWASINTLLWHSDLRRYKSELTHSGTGRWKQKVAEGEGGQGATGNWMMMVRWTRACTCKDLPVWTPEWRQCVHGHGFRQGTDAVPAPWGQAEPSQLSTEKKNMEICSVFIFPLCLIFSWERTSWLFHSLFVQFVLCGVFCRPPVTSCSAQTHTDKALAGRWR